MKSFLIFLAKWLFNINATFTFAFAAYCLGFDGIWLFAAMCLGSVLAWEIVGGPFPAP